MKNTHIAAHLLTIRAVRLQPADPFTWSSGLKSPIYCDNRLTLSYPEIRRDLTNAFVERIMTSFPQATGIAGVATGGIALGVLVAEAIGLPFVYIRSKAKGHGLQNMVEGKVDPAGQYVMIEDLVSTGGSSVKAVKALQATGASVLHTYSIFSYGFEKAQTAFAETGTEYEPLTDLQTLLEKAVAINYLSADESAAIESWRANPQAWSDQQA